MSRPVIARAWFLPTASVVVLWLSAACSTTPVTHPSTSATVAQYPSTGERTQQPGPAQPDSSPVATVPQPSSPAEPVGGADTATVTAGPSPMRQGTVAQSTRVRFVPRQIELPSGRSAVIEPVQTVDGVLQVPDDVQHVGWWGGSAYAGDPFGATVIAGHVDSRLQGLGFLAELLLIQTGDLVTLRSNSKTQTYRVVSTRLVNKEALASDNQTFDQRGPHRLALITCSGDWQPEVRSYDSNLVVIAEPLAR